MEESSTKNIKEVSKIASSSKKNISSDKSKKMKLPILRKIHLNPVYLGFGIFIAILAVFFLRVAFWEHSYIAAMEGTPRDTSNISAIEVNENTQSEEVDSTEPTEQQIAEYIVAPEKPRYISIPYIGIYKARIIEIGLKGQNEMATPYNIYDVGWYTGSGSVLPGQNGVTIINAHGGDLGYGIFRNLPKLPVGENITIEMGDGRIYTYKVVESVKKALGDEANEYMATAFTPLPGTSNTLSLITCTGDWWQNSNTYSHRLFVRATLQ